MRTDGWQGYFDVGRHPFTHVVTNLSASGDPAHVVMPHVHRVASLVQRWLLGTHQGAISHDQLDYYLDEFTFRFNRRRSRHRGLPFYRLLEGAVAADPHPTKPSPANPPLEQARSQIGGEKRIAHSRERAAPADRLRVAIDGAHRPGRRVPAGRRWARRHEGLSGLPS